MHIQISYDDGIARDTKIEEVIQKVCDEVSRVYGLEDDELSILLCDNKKIHELNKNIAVLIDQQMYCLLPLMKGRLRR